MGLLLTLIHMNIYILCSAHFKSKIKIENTIERVLSFTIIQKPTKNTLITIEKGSSGGMAESKRPLMDLWIFYSTEMF